MAKGYIYHITTEPCNLNSVDENDFENPDAIGADWCETVEDSENPEKIANLLRAAGAVVTPVDEDGDEAGASEHCAGWRIHAMSEDEVAAFKRRFFIRKFETLKTLVQGLTLDDFSTDSPAVARVESAVNERFGDAIMVGNRLGETFHTFDMAIRGLEANRDYYLSRTCVLMH